MNVWAWISIGLAAVSWLAVLLNYWAWRRHRAEMKRLDEEHAREMRLVNYGPRWNRGP